MKKWKTESYYKNDNNVDIINKSNDNNNNL